MAMGEHSARRVTYYYDEDVGNFYFGQKHPMKPFRVRLTHNLVFQYNLHSRMEICRPIVGTAKQLTDFHTSEYIRFLESVTPDNLRDHGVSMLKHNVGDEDDCPVFDGLFDYCQRSVAGSVAAAIKLNKKGADIAINWGGGMHHAKKSKAGGFCYLNDCVLAILELLKYHQRVLYIDIDVHHGDGVEEAFFTTNRVMTLSFHKFGNFFPGTGSLKDIGAEVGKYYAVNVPLNAGMNDFSYERIFNPIVSKVIEVYQPSAIVLQCGADTLTGDRIGCFNLTIAGHAKCVKFVRKFNLPLLLLGGGGYTIRNVARCWTLDTAVALDCESFIPNKLPDNPYYEYFAPDYMLHIEASAAKNQNSLKHLSEIEAKVFENLRMLPCAPGIQMQDIPEDAIKMDESDNDKDDSDVNRRKGLSSILSNKRIVPANEFYDNNDE